MRRLGICAGIVAGALALAGCGGSSGSSVHPPKGSSTPTITSPTKSTKGGTGTGHTGTSTSTGGGLPSGGPVPAGTKATSVTFISPDTALILGTAPCNSQPCSAILRTRDRGAHWVGLPAPRENVSYYLGDGLWGLRFADPRHGYAFGKGLWETFNGGRSWLRAIGPAPTVLDLEAVQGREIVALGGTCLPAHGCRSRMWLYHEPIGGSWTKVAGLGALNNYTASIAVHGADVWVLAAGSIYYSTDGGATFRSEAQPCPTRGANFGQPTSITDDGTHIYLLCTGQGFTGHTLKYVYATTGPGTAWTLVGKPPTAGDGGEISAGSDQAIVIATSSAAGWLYRSTDGGRSWKTVLMEDNGGASWGDLGFTTATDAVAIDGPALEGSGIPGKLVLSSDGGLSWHAASF